MRRVVGHADGRPIHPETITEWFTRLSWEAGLPPIRLHDVRHSYAAAALRAEVPVKVVSERLGHSSVSFTQDTYIHMIPGWTSTPHRSRRRRSWVRRRPP
ncbi:tyrosine-type recombinase/integrase [Pseudonocardia acidicola]|uniref:tyrosine-type recombinase/integrase n=1 Tax=Pseudonocardia acidicola TaxID=2724939 RepID=UPI001EF00B50|nr:tyrosine-type recombinase/integrase [Pseudonocardia acidicola]